MTLAKGSIPVPTVLLDRVMPTLRDTELRVLLVVVRQTLGWQVGKDPSLRKERDWLTQSQLMRRTGRASGAIARAIDGLVQQGLLDVLIQDERLLQTPAERRRCLGRLYFRLHKPKEAGVSQGDQYSEAKTAHAKPHITKKSIYKNRPVSEKLVDNSGDNPLPSRMQGWIRAAALLRNNPD